jgi:hypothetical protein
MDRLVISERSDRQAAASRSNGALGRGPVSEVGKSTAAANSIRHGLAARAVLLPGESAVAYEASVAGWAASLGVRSSAEAFVAARVADCAWRQERLARYEQSMWLAAVEDELKASDVYTQLAVTQAALAGIQGMAMMAEQTGGTLPGDHVRTLMPALQHVLSLVEKADAPMEQLVAFRDRLNDLVVDALLDIQPEAFHALAHAARALEEVLKAKISQVEIQVEAERQRLMQVTILGAEKELKLIERHRARLAREMESHLRLLHLVREVVTDSEPSGSFVVELRVLGRHSA